MPQENTISAREYIAKSDVDRMRQKLVSTRVAVSTDILTSREAAVLSLIVQGSTNREAGRILGISPRTIEFHRANIMQKFDARNVAELMRLLFGDK